MTIVIYVRQSLDRDGEGAAVDRQLEACRELAERQGLTVAAEYVDNDVSASKGTRPGFTRLLRAIKQGEVSTIIVWHTDRLYRRVRDLVEITELAENHAIKVLTVRAGDLDLSTPAGRMLAGMLGHAARYEVEQKGARQVASNIQRAQRGHWQFSNRPYGYERADGQIRQVPHEAERLREAYERFIVGDTYYSICQDFNERGVSTVSGRPWTVTVLRERLRNPHYAGIVTYKGDPVEAAPTWEPVISRDTWEHFQRALRRRKNRHDWSNKTKYLLSGFARCGVCDARMMARPEYRRQRNPDGSKIVVMTYQCTNKWCVSRKLEPVDELVEAVVVARLSRPDAAELLRPSIDVEPLQTEADDLRNRRDELAQLFADGMLTASAVRDSSANLTRQIDKLQAKITEASGNGPLADLIAAEDVQKRWGALAFGQRRAVLSTLLIPVIHKQQSTRGFDPEAIEIRWLSEVT